LKKVHHQLPPFGSAAIHVGAAKISAHHITCSKTGDVMERRHFLKLAAGFAAGATALGATALAAPISPQPLAKPEELPPGNHDVHSAVSSEAEVEHLKPEQVRWGHGHGRHWGWRHRHWGWRRRRWHRRHWHRRYW
jgi:hypothetical protein